MSYTRLTDAEEYPLAPLQPTRTHHARFDSSQDFATSIPGGSHSQSRTPMKRYSPARGGPRIRAILSYAPDW